MAKRSTICRLPHKKLQDTLDKRFHSVSVKLQKLIPGYGIEDIHSFRVEIKKLKSFLRLLKTNHQHPSALKIPGRLNKIYRILGQIRVLQLQEEQVNKELKGTGVPGQDIYLNKIREKTAVCRTEATDAIRQFKSIKKDKAAIKEHCPDLLLNTTVKKFISAKRNAIRKQLLQESPDETSLHTIRKHLKDIQYNSSYLKYDLPGLPECGFLQTDEIPGFTTLLGNFHDLHVALCLLDDDLKENLLPGDFKSLLLNIRNTWQGDKEKLRQEIYKKCRKFRLPDPDHLPAPRKHPA